MRSAEDVHTFWFEEHGQADWFGGKPDFDARLAARFRATHEAVARGEGFTWRISPRGRLAEIIVLDQFSRQLHRNAPQAFATDAMALALAQELVAAGHDMALTTKERMFAYLPYMHAESLVIHEQAVRLFEALGDKDALDFELRHKALIERFGRYPKRNAVLGRTSTPEELAYIGESGDSMF